MPAALDTPKTVKYLQSAPYHYFNAHCPYKEGKKLLSFQICNIYLVNAKVNFIALEVNLTFRCSFNIIYKTFT